MLLNKKYCAAPCKKDKLLFYIIVNAQMHNFQTEKLSSFNIVW